MKTKPTNLRAVLAAAAALLLAVTSGCVVAAVGAAGAAGAGTVAFIRGELDTTLSGRHESVIVATNAAITQLEFAKVRESQDALGAEIIARTALDKKIDIKLVKEADQLTRVSIRIGFFGDEEKSRAILDKIKQNLENG